MTTFLLKKYEETATPNQTETKTEKNDQESQKEMMINIEGSISEIVAKALYKTLGNETKITEIADTSKSENSTIKAISTEDINSDPVKTFKSINTNDIVFIQSKGFKTSQEEWFLTNIPNKTNQVFYSVESLIKYIKQTLGV